MLQDRQQGFAKIGNEDKRKIKDGRQKGGVHDPKIGTQFPGSPGWIQGKQHANGFGHRERMIGKHQA